MSDADYHRILWIVADRLYQRREFGWERWFLMKVGNLGLVRIILNDGSCRSCSVCNLIASAGVESLPRLVDHVYWHHVIPEAIQHEMANRLRNIHIPDDYVTRMIETGELRSACAVLAAREGGGSQNAATG